MIRVGRWIKELSAQCWLDQQEFSDWQLSRGKYILPGEYTIEVQDQIGAPKDIVIETYGTTYWLKKQLHIPQEWSDSLVGLAVDAGGEGLVRIDGVPYHGIDRNHWFVPLPVDKVGHEPLLDIELFDPIPEPIDPLNNQQVRNPAIRSIRIQLVRVNAAVQSMLYTATVIRDAARLLPEQDYKRQQLVAALHTAMDAMQAERARWTDQEWVSSLEKALADRVRDDVNLHNAGGFMHMVGQSHIDIAWLWPVRETVRKCSRTFSTVNTLMEEYPEFIYSQSQPQLYAYVKEHYPDLFEKIKARVAEGRWELVGGMWVEPDLNIPSGESFVRQLLHGQLFYQREFGKMSNIEWLPDTFGYCASLPQIMKQAGIEYFMTTKLGWNDTNEFPYDLFNWVGIDGTAMLSYQNHGVNEHTHAKDVTEHWDSFKEKNIHSEQMLLYGHGDGGGGVTREMIEFVNRSELMTNAPKSDFSTAAAFFGNISEEAKKQLPKWVGDLYLELHRGTYTTHARNKRWNRKAEVLYREAEIWNSLAPLQAEKADSVHESLVEGWKLIMLNQFHDIIPGTAITEAYVTSANEYKNVFAIGNQALQAGLDQVTAQITAEGEGTPYLVFNSLGWTRSDQVKITGEAAELCNCDVFDEQGNLLNSDCIQDEAGCTLNVYVPHIPAFGYKTIWLRAKAGEATSAAEAESFTSWETDYYIVNFDERGLITRWYDKQANRELIQAGKMANELQLFDDRPTYWDAWDIDPRYEKQAAAAAELQEKKVVHRGATKDVLRFKWKLNDSVIEQDMVFYHQDKRVDFETKVEWNETHKLLKVAFPVDVVTSKATYEIPFGALERPTHRNTSWEQAQYEVCGHRWVDVSEGDFGISLLNDCKYGYDVQGSTIRLSLLRAPRWPDETADKGEHQFTYSLYPHELDWRHAHTVRKAQELNLPVQAVKHRVQSGSLASEASLLLYESKHVILDTIKEAEDGSGTILRLYESTGSRDKAVIQVAETVKHAYVTNILEQTVSELTIENGSITLEFRPYQIQTIKLV